MAIDTTTAQGRLVLNLFASLVEFDGTARSAPRSRGRSATRRDLIRERTKLGWLQLVPEDELVAVQRALLQKLK